PHHALRAPLGHRSQPLEHGMPDIVLDDRERKLIRLLADGHTDVSAAEILHISARSVTNIMRNVMDRLGVDNRFQLGLALGAARVRGGTTRGRTARSCCTAPTAPAAASTSTRSWTRRPTPMTSPSPGRSDGSAREPSAPPASSTASA